MGKTMFDTIYTSPLTAQSFFMMAGVSLVAGLVFSWLMSFRVRSTRRFFLVTAIMPFAIATVITFVSGSIGAGIAMGGTFSLIRFRSAQGSADELAAILMAMSSGIAFGMGYLTYGVVILLGLAGIFNLIAALPIFEHGSSAERLLKAIAQDRYITGSTMVMPMIKSIGDGYLHRMNVVDLRNFFISTLPDWVK